MKLTAAKKVIAHHLAKGKMVAGEEIALNIDHTLIQDSNGTLAYLKFEGL